MDERQFFTEKTESHPQSLSCPMCKQGFLEARQTGAARLARDLVECFRFPCPRRGCGVAVLRKELGRHLELHERVEEHRRKRRKCG